MAVSSALAVAGTVVGLGMRVGELVVVVVVATVLEPATSPAPPVVEVAMRVTAFSALVIVGIVAGLEM